jgi:hypothetical protein
MWNQWPRSSQQLHFMALLSPGITFNLVKKHMRENQGKTVISQCTMTKSNWVNVAERKKYVTGNQVADLVLGIVYNRSNSTETAKCFMHIVT